MERTALTKKQITALHARALVINQKFDAAMILKRLTNWERNAIKRTAETMSPFNRNTKPETQSFKIDCALAEFHSVVGLAMLLGYPEARIRSHIKHLETNFSHLCKKETDGRKVRFIRI